MSSMALKLVAVITMIVDHTGAILLHVPGYFDLSQMMRTVGRVAFPLFVFLIAEGMRKTSSRPKYLIWLGVFALISIIPFSLFTSVAWWGFAIPFNPLRWDIANVFFTLFLGAASIYVFDIARVKFKDFANGAPGIFLGLLAPAAFGFLAWRIQSDYDLRGVLVIFAVYAAMLINDAIPVKKFAGEWVIPVLPLVIWAHIVYPPGLIGTTIGGPGLHHWALAAAVAPLLILLYDGTPGTAKLRGRAKILFYVFYPAHLLILYAWSFYLRPR